MNPSGLALLLVLAILPTVARADDPPPLLASPGKLLFEDDFAREKMAPKWKTGLGFWSIKDGVVSATENPADHHGATAKATVAFKDVVAEFSFKLDGSRQFNVPLDDNTFKGSHAGHIARVIISATRLRLEDSKFGIMNAEVYEKLHDPKATDADKKKVQDSIQDKIANFKINIDPAQWHRARIEIAGDEMLVSIDGKPAGYLKAEGVGHPTKKTFGFTVPGKSTLMDNVKLYEAAPSPDWPSQRAEVLASLRR